MSTQAKNKSGKWVPAIPEPLYVFPFSKQCYKCWYDKKYPHTFWTMDGYRGHYALVHVLEI